MIWLMILLFTLFTAQPDALTIDTVSQFAPVRSIDFDELGDFDSGWFAYDAISGALAVVDVNETLMVVAPDDRILLTYRPVGYGDEPVTFLDGVIHNELLAAAYAVPDGFVMIRASADDNWAVHQALVETRDRPVELWLNCDDKAPECDIWAELSALEGLSGDYIVRVPPFHDEVTLPVDSIYVHENPINDDSTAVVRIGRIPLPYEVTSTIDGLIRLWNLETGEVVREVDNTTGIPGVFGAMNAEATHLLWRDNASETLYLLNMINGTNRTIAALDGAYVQWFFLAPDASVALGINYGGETGVFAWDVTTGERQSLGDYRQCGRPQPDKASFTNDGTTLVIGCDTGIEVWQVG